MESTFMVGSLAASRRTNCSRWVSAALGRISIWMRYLPFEAFSHPLMIASAVPELSGFIHHVMVLSLLLDPPQAASVDAATAETTATLTALTRLSRLRTTIPLCHASGHASGHASADAARTASRCRATGTGA